MLTGAIADCHRVDTPLVGCPCQYGMWTVVSEQGEMEDGEASWSLIGWKVRMAEEREGTGIKEARVLN